jgi:hypothetical protein
MRKRRYRHDPIDPTFKRFLHSFLMLMFLGVMGILSRVIGEYPTLVEMAVGLPAMAAIPMAIAAAVAGEKSQMVERTWITVGLVALSGLLLFVLHLLIPSLGSSS